MLAIELGEVARQIHYTACLYIIYCLIKERIVHIPTFTTFPLSNDSAILDSVID